MYQSIDRRKGKFAIRWMGNNTDVVNRFMRHGPRLPYILSKEDGEWVLRVALLTGVFVVVPVGHYVIKEITRIPNAAKVMTRINSEHIVRHAKDRVCNWKAGFSYVTHFAICDPDVFCRMFKIDKDNDLSRFLEHNKNNGKCS